MSDADRLVERFILARYRQQDHDSRRTWTNPNPEPSHLAVCPEITVLEAETRPTLFYDTGVDGVEFTARLGCPHTEPVEFEFGELGELPDILDELAELDS